MEINVMTDVTNTGIRGLGFTLAGTPLFYLLKEEAYVALIVWLAIYLDYRFAKKECAVRCAAAKKSGAAIEEKFRWRASRAWRRSLNKFMDELLICTFGFLVGVTFVEPAGGSRLLGTLLFAGVIIAVEGKSIWEHLGNIDKHGGGLNRMGGVWAFLKNFAVIFAKKKDQDVGEALEEAFGTNQ